MRTTRQVAIYCMFREKGRNFYILVKRIDERGGFWQPLTGGEEDFDGGNLHNTVIRETKEELGIDIMEKEIVEIPYSFTFTDKKNVQHTEQCFGIVFSSETKEKIKLSEEHNAIIYAENIDYLKSLLKFQENRIGLEKFSELAK